MEINEINRVFWKNKKVFITGHTGFKGTWLSLLLKHLGAEVYGYSLEPKTTPSLFKLAKVENFVVSTIGDIRYAKDLENAIALASPDILIHMAAQPLVRYSYANPLETFEVNVMGTVNLFESLRNINVRAVVNVTTDKVYENNEWHWAYRENEKLGGYDPYSSSKACSELVTSAYTNSYFRDTNKIANCAIATARAGNVIGGGDWSEDRLIPDIIKALVSNEKIIIRNPNSIRPWQHVLEPLVGYLILAERLYTYGNKYSGAWNFGPNEKDSRSVKWIVDKLSTLWGGKIDIEVKDPKQLHEAANLKLDCSKANNLLGWYSKWGLEETLESIVTFNQSLLNSNDVQELCFNQILKYFKTKNH